MIAVPKHLVSSKLAELQLQRELTGVLPNFMNPKQKKTIRFYEETATAWLVPRFYAFRHFDLCLDASMAEQFEVKSKPELAFTLQQTASRPQVAVHEAAVAKIRKDGGCSVILPCGTGKTQIAIAIQNTLGLSTLILCHSNKIMVQWKERLEQCLDPVPKIGWMQQDRCEPGDIVIGSILSLLSRDYPENARRYGLVIVDEAHHVPALSFSQSLRKLTYTYSLGLTATPKRADGLERLVYYFMGSSCYTHVTPKRPEVQVNMITFYPGPWKPINFKSGTPATTLMISKLVKSQARNLLLASVVTIMFRKFPDRQGLLLSDRVAHLETLYKLLQQRLGADHVRLLIGKKDTGEAGKSYFITLSTFKLYAEAMDFDGSFIVLATSKSNVEQPTGRILRGKNKDVDPVIFDVVDQYSVFPGQANRRMAYYRQRGYTIVELKEEDVKRAAAASQ